MPGYAVGVLANVFSFRDESGASKFLIAVIVSISVFPIIYYTIIRYTHASLVWGIVGGAIFVLLYHYYCLGLYKSNTWQVKLVGAKRIAYGLALWGVLILLVIDLKIDGQLVTSLMTYDYVKHIAVTDAITRTSIPPVNPSFYPGKELDLFYYYFWFIFPSLIDQVGAGLISPRHAVLAGILWGPLGLIAIAWFFIKKFGRIAIPDIDPRYYPLIVSMLAITGLDLLPILGHKVLEHLVGIPPYRVPSIEWWNEQVTSWVGSIIWVPHHVSALVATLFVFMLIRDCVDTESISTKRHYVTAIILCSLALASAFGMSIWVTLVFLCFLIIWFILVSIKGYKDEVHVLLGIGFFSLIFVLPYVVELQGANHLNTSVIVPSVRSFFLVDAFDSVLDPAVLQLTRLIFLPVNYFVELGFFFLGGMYYFFYRMKWKQRISRQELYIIVLLSTSVTICTFIKADIKHNDLGWRGFMFTQLILLLYSAPLYVSVFKKGGSKKTGCLTPIMRSVTTIVLVLGVTANIYEMTVLRTHSLGPSGEKGIKLREMYDWVEKNTHKEVIIQHNPDEEVEYYHALYGHRQVLLADRTLGKLYGINDYMYEQLYESLYPIFNSNLSTQELVKKARILNLDIIILKKSDSISADSTDWMRDLKPIFENSEGSVYSIAPLQ